MRITPMDIRQQQFTVRMFRGFDGQEVETFLEELAGDFEALLKENALLKEQLQVLEERTRGLEDRERVLQETLVTTHKVVEEIKEGARKEAGARRARGRAAREKNLEGARVQVATMQAEVAALKRTRQQLTESLRSTVEMYGRLLNQEDARADEADGKT